MAKYIFQTEDGLGNVVQSFKPFCTLSPNRPIYNPKYVTQDICGSKFSKLCGFIFTSLQDSEFRNFLIVYCPKLRNNHLRNEKGLSGWYCWKHISSENELVVDKNTLKLVYGFDVDKFFNSDVFEKYLPMFKEQTTKALNTVVKDFIKRLPTISSEKDPYSRSDVQFYVECIKDSISKMDDVLSDNKLAYNANGIYSLDMKDRKKVNEANHGYPEYEFNTIGDFESFFSMLYHEKDLDSRRHMIFWDEKGHEHKIVRWALLNNGINFWMD